MVWNLIVAIIFVINVIFAIGIIFFERNRKNIGATFAWLVVLFFIPGVGFVLYLIFGQTFNREKLFKVKAELDAKQKSLLKEQLEKLQEYKAGPSDNELDKYLAMAHMLLVSDMALVSCQFS